MQIVRIDGPEIVRIGTITSTIGAVLDVDDQLGAQLLKKTSVTFQPVGAVDVPKNKRGTK